MKTLEFVPKVGIGPVKLGMTRQQVATAMWEKLGERGQSYDSLDYFINNGFQVEYIDEKASFIGISNLFPDGYWVIHKGVNIFDLDSDALHQYFRQFDQGPLEDNIFPKIIVALAGADKQYDYIGGHSRAVCGQVGIGNQAYLEAVRRINKL